MKNVLRKCAVILVALLLLAAVPVLSATAEEDGPELVVAFGSPDEQGRRTITVSFENAWGIDAANVTLEFNPEEITPVSEAEYDEPDEYYGCIYNIKADCVKFAFMCVDDDGFTDDEVLILGSPLFTLADEAQAADYIEVTATVTTFMCNGEVYSDEQKAAMGDVKRLSIHNYGDAVYTFSSDYQTCTAMMTCQDEICNHHIQAETVGTNYIVKGNPDCESSGRIWYTADFTKEGFEDQEIAVQVDKIGHTGGEPVIDPNSVHPASCTADGSHDMVTRCVRCNKELSREHVIDPAFGHTPAEEVREHEIPSQCLVKGSYDRVIYCKTCGVELERETIITDALEHRYIIPVDRVDPTCTEQGYTVYKCYRCGNTINDDFVEATGHEWGAWTSVDGNNHQRVCAHDNTHVETAAHEWDDGEITAEPTVTAEGTRTFTCADCHTTREESIPRIDGVVILSQPENVTLLAGQKATFTVEAAGIAPHYQWMVSTDGGETWKNTSLAGNKTPALTVTVKAAYNGYMYRCEITDVNNSVTSDPATLLAGPSIKAQPRTQYLPLGSTAEFTIAASCAKGLHPTYQWTVSTNGGETWKRTTLPGNNTPTLTVPIKLAYNGYLYRCKVTDENGSVSSKSASLLVRTVITSQTADQVMPVGSTALFNVEVSGVNPEYQWVVSTNSGETWKRTTLPGNDTPTLSVPVKAAYNGFMYMCKVIDVNGTTLSDPAMLSIESVITSQPSNQLLAVGSTASFSVAVSGVKPSYQWQVSTDGGNTWKNSGAAGSTTESISFSVTASRNNYKYRCVITDSNSTLISEPGTLNVKTAITAEPKSVTQAVGTTAQFTVKATGITPMTYQWYVSINGGTSWKKTTLTGNNTATLSVPVKAAYNGYMYRCKVTGANNAVTSTAAKLTVS